MKTSLRALVGLGCVLVGGIVAVGAVAPLRRPPLPAWFDSARVQGHTRLPLERWGSRPAFLSAAARFRSLGLRVFTRHVKSSSRSPFIVGASPSDVRLGADSARLRAAFAAAHREGEHTIAYVWISSDSAMASKHPDWVCRNPNGRTPARAPRGTPLDVTSDYREVILGELDALAAAGADGFFFDWSHLPPAGCWSPHLVQGFERATGSPAPRRRDARDPRYRAFLAYTASQLEQTFDYLRDAVHRRYPDAVFVVSVSTLPTLMDPRFQASFASAGDVPKTEFEAPLRRAFAGWQAPSGVVPRDIRLAAGWSLVRDGAGGRPPLIWALGFADSAQAEGFVAAVLTQGGIASLDVADPIVAGRTSAPHATPLPALRAAAALGDRVAPGLVGTHPIAWAGIHFPEVARDRLMSDPDVAWNRVVLPALRTYGVLLRARAAVRFVTDSALDRGDLDGLRLLVLPDSADLSAAQKARVDAFRAKGGSVVGPDGVAEAVRAGPVQVLGGPTTMHVGFFGEGDGQTPVPASSRTTILLTPDFSWVEPLQLRGTPGPPAPAPPPISGVVIRWPVGSRSAAGSPGVHAKELVSGRDLPVTRTGDGAYDEVHVPSFRILAAVVLSRR